MTPSRSALPLALLVAACGGDGGRQVGTAAATLAATPAGAVATAESVSVDRPLTLPSQLYVEHDATVLARSSGVVESILADIGTRVAAGQPLARLESTDQEIALNKALYRLREAEAKVEKTRQWHSLLPRALAEYEGPARQLLGMLDADSVRGLAILDQKIDSLDAYLSAATPSAPSPAAAATPDGKKEEA